jgi:integrase
MTRIKLKGLHWATRKLPDGRVVTYWYAWRGGPRLPGKPDSPEFVATYKAAVAEREARPIQTLDGLVRAYQQSPEYAICADATREKWGRWLDRIVAHPIGELPLEAAANPRFRAHLLKWRDEYANTSLRNGDYAVEVLSVCLSWGVKRGIIAANPIKGTPALYQSDRADMIWTDKDLERFAAVASLEVATAVKLACLTGLRRADLASLVWGEIGERTIIKSPSKARVKALPGARRRTRGKHVAIIPVTPELKALLEEIGRRGPDETVLTTVRGRPWKPSQLTNTVVDAKHAAGLEHLHLHDCRGTFITKLAKEGYALAEIARIVGWKSERVEQLLAVYADHTAVVMHIIGKREMSDRADIIRPSTTPDRARVLYAGVSRIGTLGVGSPKYAPSAHRVP